MVSSLPFFAYSKLTAHNTPEAAVKIKTTSARKSNF